LTEAFVQDAALDGCWLLQCRTMQKDSVGKRNVISIY